MAVITAATKQAAGEKPVSGLSGAARLCALALLLFTTAAAAANLEEKTRYERALEQKVEEVLAGLLGPGRSRVMIRAAVDFSSRENVESIVLESGENKPEPVFKWQDINKQAASEELLPGFPAGSKEEAPRTTKPGGGKYQRDVSFPQSMVKRLTVSLVLSEDLPAAEAQKVRRVVSDLLALDPARGDDILILRARFAPIWYTYEMLLTLVKFGIVAVFTVFCTGLILIGFLKIASALRARQAPGPVRMQVEMSGVAAVAPGPAGLPGPAETAPSAEKNISPVPPEEPSGGVVFDVKADKLEILVKLLAKDEPADISLIAVHLPAGLRGKFISMLPPETAAEVLANTVKVRFVEPELLARIKDGLEVRLNGTVGGYEKAVEMIEKAGIRAREALLGAMERTHPEVAARVRSRILLPGDLEKFTDRDFAILAGAVPAELWAAACWRLPERAHARLKDHLTERAWQILEQNRESGKPGDEKIDAAAEEVLSAAWKLINEGRIKKPAPEAAAIGLDHAAAAPES